MKSDHPLEPPELRHLAPMQFAGSWQAVPKGLVIIAQRFNAGGADEHRRVPKGRLNDDGRLRPFSRPVGTHALRTTFPTLKRRAIVGCPSGTTLRVPCV